MDARHARDPAPALDLPLPSRARRRAAARDDRAARRARSASRGRAHGHAPLDLIHLVKRVCAELEEEGRFGSAFRAYGLCYLELNAALGAGLGGDWPVAVDHGSITETSWMLAIEPALVRLDGLPEDAEGPDIVGIYGPNPRSRASAALGRGQLDACARLLADRATRLVAGERLDTMADLRAFVERYWPEPLALGGRAGTRDEAAVLLTNDAPVSRYLTSLRVVIDGEELDAARVALLNSTFGEAGTAVAADSLGPEQGFYVRRGQTAEARLPASVAPGPHALEVELGLAGVAQAVLHAEVTFG